MRNICVHVRNFGQLSRKVIIFLTCVILTILTILPNTSNWNYSPSFYQPTIPNWDSDLGEPPNPANYTDVDRDVPRDKKKLFVLIVAGFRTGSTFLGELFNQNSDFLYSFEPLHYMSMVRLVYQGKIKGIPTVNIWQNVYIIRKAIGSAVYA